MKKSLLLSINVLLIFDFSIAQNTLVKMWDYGFGGTDVDYLRSWQQTNDGGYIFGGYSNSDSSGDKTQYTKGSFDYWIVKTDSLCNIQWDRDFGGTNNDYLFSLLQTAEGGYILGGFSRSGISGDKTQDNWDSTETTFDYWIVKTDSFGNKQWDRDFGGVNNDLLYSLQQTLDGGYILGGYSDSDSSGDKTQSSWGSDDFWIVKTDSMGNKQWDKRFGGYDADELLFIQKTIGGGYILGGFSHSNISGDKTQATWGGWDYWILKTDSLGIKEWDKDFGGTNDDYLFSIQQTTNNGFILGGHSNSGISGDKAQATWGVWDYWILKTDSLGNKQWDKDFGGTNNEEFHSTFFTHDGGYLFSGDSYSPISGDKTENNLGSEQVWVVKTDSLGNKQWDKTIFTNGHDENGLAFQTGDRCYAIANTTDAGIGGDKTQACQGNYDYWIIKFCDTTSTTTISNIHLPNSKFQIFPNPANDLINISFPSSEQQNVALQIYDLYGREVFQSSIFNSKSLIKIDVSNFSQGVYFVRMTMKEKEYSAKLIKL